MNTSHLSQNLSEIQALDAKTGENLNRLGKISEKLKNIHSNITSEKISRYTEVEARLGALNDKTEESQNEILKNFESTKKEIAELIQMIENDRISFDESYEARTQYISKLEFKLMEQFNNERDERNAMCNRLISNIDNKYMILRNELAKEEKNRDESIDNFKNYLESEVPKLVSQMKNEQETREVSDQKMEQLIDNEVNKIINIIKNEKQTREETEEAFLDMLRSIINKIKEECEIERKNREATETNLLNLLEETCAKLDEVAKST